MFGSEFKTKNVFQTAKSEDVKPAKNIFATKTEEPPKPDPFTKGNIFSRSKNEDAASGNPFAINRKLEKPPVSSLFTTKKEKPKSEIEDIPSLPNEQDLYNLIRSQAVTEQDKYEILEARDKIFRSKGLHFSQGIVLKGTCPDFCPEKERYSRLVKNQLRVYEKSNDEMDPRSVIKEYSRSSADQDIPLPHELRPISVLNKTMDHLLCNVIDRVDHVGTVSMDTWYQCVLQGVSPQSIFSQYQNRECSDNMGDWFEFIWSTTRAIRKDLTQQQITNVDAVRLVEKCARFHIMCAARLVEEDSHNFDKKLNDENMTKCLQTLKHMYEDLAHEQVRKLLTLMYRLQKRLSNQY